MWLGIVKFDQGDIDAWNALSALAVELEPLWALPVINAARDRIGNGRLSEARQLIEPIKKYQPENPLVFDGEARLLFAERREADSIRLRLRGLEVIPGDLANEVGLFFNYMDLLAPDQALCRHGGCRPGARAVFYDPCAHLAAIVADGPVASLHRT